MKARTLLMTAAVSLALAGLSGCSREETKTSRETTTTTPPSATVPATPPATATAPAPNTPGIDRSAGTTVDDATVTAKVKAALLAESGVDGTKINVDTFNGRVTLKGDVPSKSMADRAVQVARGVEGVRDVDNRLNAGAG